MFYYNNWEKFCRWIVDSGLTTYTAEESLTAASTERFIVLKHDVETDVARALRLARIEHRHGIKGSYYVQAYLLDSERNIEMLKLMRNMGHEISYHYDILDANNGDFKAAEKDFERRLQQFHNSGFRFRTICQHGNPVKERKGYTSNRDFFRNSAIKQRYSMLVDMVVDYSRYAPGPYFYVSDAGYMWKHITEPETNDLNPKAASPEIGNFERLRAFINSTDKSLIISTHPHRWEESKARITTKIIAFRIIRSGARIAQKIPGVKSLMNKFYFLAKKI